MAQEALDKGNYAQATELWGEAESVIETVCTSVMSVPLTALEISVFSPNLCTNYGQKVKIQM